MRKVLLFILLLIGIESCYSVRSFYIVDKYYGESQKEYVINNIYEFFNVISVDTIPIEEWKIVSIDTISTTKHIDRTTTIKTDDAIYSLDFKIFYNSNITYYNYKIKCTTKNYNIWKGL